MGKRKVVLIGIVALIVVLAIVFGLVFGVFLKDDSQTANVKNNADYKELITVSFECNGGIGAKSITLPVGDKLKTTPIPTREGYTFEGWFLDKDLQSPYSAEFVPAQSVTLYAKWSKIPVVNPEPDNPPPTPVPEPNYYTVKFDVAGGTLVEEQVVKEGECVAIPSTTEKEGYVFDGWYNGAIRWDFAQNAVSDNITLVAHWTEKNGLTRSGNMIYFGSYPQSRVSDTDTIAKLNAIASLPTSQNARGWTSYGYYSSGRNKDDYMWYADVEYNGKKYRGVYMTHLRPYDPQSGGGIESSYQDDNGYVAEIVYWFAYEPIKWRVLGSATADKQTELTLICDIALDAQAYDYDGAYSNNYGASTIRAWLNDEFYNTAFNGLQKEALRTVEVDNSAESTGYKNNANACANTLDKVYLLSGANASNMSASALIRKATDYALCQGCNTSDDGCYWRLRSPYDYDAGCSLYVKDNGIIRSRYSVYYSDFGVVPMVNVLIPSAE